MQPAMMAQSWNPAFRWLKQEDYEFKASLVSRNKQTKAGGRRTLDVN